MDAAAAVAAAAAFVAVVLVLSLFFIATVVLVASLFFLRVRADADADARRGASAEEARVEMLSPGGEYEGWIRRRRSRSDGREGTRLVGRHDRTGQGVRHRSVFRGLHQPARRLPRDDGALVRRSGDRQAVRV